MKKFFLTGAMLVLVGACASTETQAPTHHWASQDSVSAIKYQQDHARCQVSADIKVSDTTYASDSEAFKKYSQCMNSAGYVLTASNEQ